jgi:hypothetical protein
MHLSQGQHLAYCTNIHRGNDWDETFDALQRHTLEVRKRVCPNAPFAIGLRLGAQAAHDLTDPATLKVFQYWLKKNGCYVFTINGFPYGQFHGTRVKEQVYSPDWTSRERLDYTCCLFDLLAKLLPDGIDGSVSTVPGSFKEFIKNNAQADAIQANLWTCVEHIDRVGQRTGKQLHLGLEPEPLCYLETSAEVALFFQKMRADRRGDDRVDRYLGITYDTCHLAVEFEEPADVIRRLQQFGVKLSKIHLSSALKVQPTAEARRALNAFADDTYLHQVIERQPDGRLTRFRDLGEAMSRDSHPGPQPPLEWRIHFHIPLHYQPTATLGTTADHILGVLDELKRNPALCSHLEMETYTWEVLPPELKNRGVVDQLVGEYEWTLAQLRERSLA